MGIFGPSSSSWGGSHLGSSLGIGSTGGLDNAGGLDGYGRPTHAHGASNQYSQSYAAPPGPPPSNPSQHPEAHHAPLTPHAMPPLASGSTGVFPPSFPVFNDMSLSSAQSTYIIGPSAKQPDFVARCSNDLRSTIRVFSHGGHGPQLAEISTASMIGSKERVTFADGRTVEMRTNTLKSYKFEMAVGHAHGEERVEEFQWKRGGLLKGGWKLIRKRDGVEVVEVDEKAAWKGMGECIGTFSFVGPGATGELGGAWADMAAVSFLKVYHMYVIAKVISAVV